MSFIPKSILHWKCIFILFTAQTIASEQIELYEEYRRLNENYQGKHFSDFSSEEYKTFMDSLKDTSATKGEKVSRLKQWAQYAGVPLLAVNQHSLFFHANLHILPKLGSIHVDSLDNYKGFETCFYDDKVELRRGDTVSSRPVTNDLNNNALCYLYKAEYGEFFPVSIHKNEAQAFYTKFVGRGPGKISYEFIKDYIIPLESLADVYLSHILEGLGSLPQAVAKIMIGKALYISSVKGISRNIHTSQNMLINSYLGLIPGLFLERHRRDEMIPKTVVHEIGHLIDHTVLRPYYEDQIGISIPFYYQFPAFFTLLPKRNELFQGNPRYVKEARDDQKKTNVGFITNYSEENKHEDFAEHFRAFIMDYDKFKEHAEKELRQERDNMLLQKFTFMNKLLNTTAILKEISIN